MARTVPWAALALVVLCWDLLGLDTGAHEPHLTISALTQAFRPMNAAALLVWMLVGLGYGAARARRPEFPGHVRHGNEMGALALCLGLACSHVPPIQPALLLPADRAAGVAFWVGVVVVVVLLDAIARRSGGRLATAEEVLGIVTAKGPANFLAALAWVAAGYHLFAG